MIDIKLTSKAISIPIRHNAYYKLVVMLAIINYCANGKKASLYLIHIIFWGLRNDENFKILYDFSNNIRNTLVPWSFESDIDKILSLAFIHFYCDRYITADGLEIKISNLGEDVLKKIEELELFKEDLSKIKSLGKIPKSRIINANKNWTLI